MRIAHVITRLIVGGAQENTILCCQDLAEHTGDDVLLITGPPLGPEGSLVEDARARKVPIAMIDSMRRSIHPWRDLKSYRNLKRVLKDFRPEVVHTHSAKAGVLGRYAASALNIPAIVHTVHGAPFHPYQNPVSRWMFRVCERSAAKHCHQLVSVADSMTDLMVAAKIAERNKFITIYSGMDVDLFLQSRQQRNSVRKELGYQDQHVVVGKVARLFHLKGHVDVIEAARDIVACQPNVRFLMVGDGVLRNQLQARIDRHGLQDHFQFTGLVSPQRVAELIGAMDILVHASLREGLARALPQALISGVPVVSYDIDGACEVVEQDVTGYLVEPCDRAGLSKALIELGEDPDKRSRMGAEGQQRCREQFRYQKMSEMLRELYQRLLNA